jgi:hypothetical protein
LDREDEILELSDISFWLVSLLEIHKERQTEKPEPQLARHSPAAATRLRDDGWSIRGSFFRFYLIN